MHVERRGDGYVIRSHFSNIKLVGCCEDAYLCKAERDGKPCLILDRRWYDPPGNLNVMEFEDETERDAYLTQQFGPLVKIFERMLNADAQLEDRLAQMLDLIDPLPK